MESSIGQSVHRGLERETWETGRFGCQTSDEGLLSCSGRFYRLSPSPALMYFCMFNGSSSVSLAADGLSPKSFLILFLVLNVNWEK